MKIGNIREVKTRFSRYVRELPKSGSVLITRNGRPCAALVPVTEDTDLEALALSQNKRFWKLIDGAIARGKKRGLRRSGGPLRSRAVAKPNPKYLKFFQSGCVSLAQSGERCRTIRAARVSERSVLGIAHLTAP